ncbi:MAG: ferritin-like domain-containing protein [Kofleriaceae bacterium]|nr:ferritin-like domain-containing protein [Kofleriaceae bacterium]
MPIRSREQIIHQLYEAAELEHDLMCTYLYAAFSLKDGEAEGLTRDEAAAVARWRRTITEVALQEMGHLVAVWNITSALGGTPRFGRGNFPLDPGGLPASVVVKLSPFSANVLQHFIFLERPADSTEPEGEGFAPPFVFRRGVQQARITPMGFDYDTVGAYYAALDRALGELVARHGESGAFCGDPALQISLDDVPMLGTRPVICLKTVTAAFSSIVTQGEGARDVVGSHYQKFSAIRDELAGMRARNPGFEPAHPAACNPVLRPPLRPEGRVWLENEEAAQTVDLANAAYGLMLRLLGYAYVVPRPSPEKRVALDLAQSLMRAFTPLAERAARLPAGPSNPGVNAGVSFTALRDASPFPPGAGARRAFIERAGELAALAATLDTGDRRVNTARHILDGVLARATRGFVEPTMPATVSASMPSAPATTPVAASPASPNAPKPDVPPTPVSANGVDRIEGTKLTLMYEGKKCIHSRFCVTGAPTVFLANVKGPWINPDAMDVERLVDISHQCPSGAIRYARKDGRPDEAAPPVNLLRITENGPYHVRAEIQLDGAAAGFRATLCRCGASKNKPFCDGSHHAIDFAATGEPLTESADMLPVRDGPLAIDPQLDGPLVVRGNLEIISGTGRVVARLVQTKLCRCGGSQNKPFCDGSHARIGFRSQDPSS